MSKKSRFISALLLVSAIAVLAGIEIASRTSASTTAVALLTPTPSRLWQPGDSIPVAIPSLEPTPAKSRDLAPQVATKDKALVILRYATGERERVYLRDEDVEAFIKKLDKSITLENFFPSESVLKQLIGHEPPRATEGPIENEIIPTEVNPGVRPTPVSPPTPTP